MTMAGTTMEKRPSRSGRSGSEAHVGTADHTLGCIMVHFCNSTLAIVSTYLFQPKVEFSSLNADFATHGYDLSRHEARCRDNVLTEKLNEINDVPTVPTVPTSWVDYL